MHSILLFTLNKEEQKIVDAIFFFGGGDFPIGHHSSPNVTRDLTMA